MLWQQQHNWCACIFFLLKQVWPITKIHRLWDNCSPLHRLTIQPGQQDCQREEMGEIPDGSHTNPSSDSRLLLLHHNISEHLYKDLSPPQHPESSQNVFTETCLHWQLPINRASCFCGSRKAISGISKACDIKMKEWLNCMSDILWWLKSFYRIRWKQDNLLSKIHQIFDYIPAFY